MGGHHDQVRVTRPGLLQDLLGGITPGSSRFDRKSHRPEAVGLKGNIDPHLLSRSEIILGRLEDREWEDAGEDEAG